MSDAAAPRRRCYPPPAMQPRLTGLVDSHCHLDYPPMSDDLPAALERARAAGVVQIVHIGCSRRTARAAVATAEALQNGVPEIFCAIGIHPHEATTVDDEALAELRALARSPRVVAIGETGLDYHYNRSPPEVQRTAMARQMALADALGLPVVFHIRDAHADAQAIVDAQPPARPGVIHCFSGTPEEADAWVARGFYLSFSGIVTFPSAAPVQDAARRCPGDRLLLETDAPYLAPVPKRGRKNEPGYVAFTCAHIAGLRGQDPGELAAQAAANTRLVLGLGAPRAADAGPAD